MCFCVVASELIITISVGMRWIIVILLASCAVASGPPNTTDAPTANPTTAPTSSPTACVPNTGNLTEVELSYMQLTTIGGCSNCTTSEADFVVVYRENECWADDWKYNDCPPWDSWSVFVHGGLFTVMDDSVNNFIIEIEPTTSKVDISVCNSPSWSISLLKALPLGNHCTSFLFYEDVSAVCSNLRIDCTTPHVLFNVSTSAACATDDSGLSSGELIGIIIGSILGVLIIAMTLVLMCCGNDSGYRVV